MDWGGDADDALCKPEMEGLLSLESMRGQDVDERRGEERSLEDRKGYFKIEWVI